MTTPKPKHLGPALRRRVNILAHDIAVRHEMRLRADLMAKVQAAANAGATGPELEALVDSLEPQTTKRKPPNESLALHPTPFPTGDIRFG